MANFKHEWAEHDHFEEWSVSWYMVCGFTWYIILPNVRLIYEIFKQLEQWCLGQTDRDTRNSIRTMPIGFQVERDTRRMDSLRLLRVKFVNQENVSRNVVYQMIVDLYRLQCVMYVWGSLHQDIREKFLNVFPEYVILHIMVAWVLLCITAERI